MKTRDDGQLSSLSQKDYLHKSPGEVRPHRCSRLTSRFLAHIDDSTRLWPLTYWCNLSDRLHRLIESAADSPQPPLFRRRHRAQLADSLRETQLLCDGTAVVVRWNRGGDTRGLGGGLAGRGTPSRGGASGFGGGLKDMVFWASATSAGMVVTVLGVASGPRHRAVGIRMGRRMQRPAGHSASVLLKVPPLRVCSGHQGGARGGARRPSKRLSPRTVKSLRSPWSRGGRPGRWKDRSGRSRIP